MKSFQNMVMSFFQRIRSQCSVESLYDRHSEKMMLLQLMVFVDTATLCLKLWDIVINSLHVKKFAFLSLTQRNSARHQKESQTNYENNIYKKRAITSKRCTNLVGGSYRIQIFILGSICVNHPPTKCLSA